MSTFAAEAESEGMQLCIKKVLRYASLLSPFDQTSPATGTVALILGNTTVFCYNKKVVSALTNAFKRLTNDRVIGIFYWNKI